MLAQVFGPRFDHEVLYVARRFYCIREETPKYCAVTESDSSYLLHHPAEFSGFRRWRLGYGQLLPHFHVDRSEWRSMALISDGNDTI